MNSIICLLVLIPYVLTGPVQQERSYIPEENDPNFKRFVFVENDNGKIELIDLQEGEFQPRFQPSTSDVSYDLYTQNNKDQPYRFTSDNIYLLPNSTFDPRKLTMFVCHGWRNDRNSPVNREIKKATFGNLDINLFIIDWSGPANNLYVLSKNWVVPVGNIVGNFITTIQDIYGIDGSSFVLVGHSLGAHLLGVAGAGVKNQIEHIIGLDPAGPLYSLKYRDERLDNTDAKFVQVIHTNGALLGIGSAIGTVDYFPNGGMEQRGCGLDFAGVCAHARSYKYFAEALSNGPVFPAVLCNTYKNFEKGLCNCNQVSTMGNIIFNVSTYGDYYLNTDSKEPFSLS